MLPNVAFSLVPMPSTVAMITTEMPAPRFARNVFDENQRVASCCLEHGNRDIRKPSVIERPEWEGKRSHRYREAVVEPRQLGARIFVSAIFMEKVI
jgi:hypothetical protein